MNSRKFSIIIALFVFVINIFFVVFFKYISLTKPLPKWINGESVSEGLMFSYIYITTLVIIFLLVKTIKQKTLSNILCILTLFLTFFPYLHIYLQKSIFLNEELQTRQIYTNALLLDWISFLLVMILLVLQIIITSKNLLHRKYPVR